MTTRPTKPYRVLPGHIFAGMIFNGFPIIISGEARIWDADSVGRSYPAANCEEITEEQRKSILDERAKREHRAGFNRYWTGGELGPTGHGDTCHSDADPGL